MHPAAVGLVLLSAVTHVYWNYQIKRSPSPAVYTWWMLVIGALLFAPVAVWVARPVTVPPAGWYCVAGTAVLYGGYFTLISLSYDREELSRAYPIARGVAPVATAAWGVLFHHEHPSLAGGLGIAAIALGVFALSSSPLRTLYQSATRHTQPLNRMNRIGRMDGIDEEGERSQGGRALFSSSGTSGPSCSSCELSPVARRSTWVGIVAAVGTGLCTSGYSAVDKEGVKHVHPALYIVLTFAAGAVAQGVFLWPRVGGPAFLREARRAGAGMALAAAASLGGYLLILEVLRTEPVSYVVPLRSISVLLSVFAGTRWLGEAQGLGRFAAAALILAGITAITLGG